MMYQWFVIQYGLYMMYQWSVIQYGLYMMYQWFVTQNAWSKPIRGLCRINLYLSSLVVC